MKDLQKQLNIERKKNERMQEKLTELLSGDKAGLCSFTYFCLTYAFSSHLALDELFYIPKTDGSRQGDTAYVECILQVSQGILILYDFSDRFHHSVEEQVISIE